MNNEIKKIFKTQNTSPVSALDSPHVLKTCGKKEKKEIEKEKRIQTETKQRFEKINVTSGYNR